MTWKRSNRIEDEQSTCVILDPNTWYPSNPTWHNLRCCRIQNKVAAIKLPLTDLSHFRIFTTITFKLGRPTLVRPDLVSLYIRHNFSQQNICILWIYWGTKPFATQFWFFPFCIFWWGSWFCRQWPVTSGVQGAWGRVGLSCHVFLEKEAWDVLDVQVQDLLKVCTSTSRSWSTSLASLPCLVWEGSSS